MNIESIAIPAVAIGILGVVLFLFLARRVMRLFVRLALAGIVVLAILIGGALMWWRGSNVSTSQPKDNRTPATRRSTVTH